MSQSKGSGRRRKHYLFAYGTLLPGLAPARMRHLVQKLKLAGRGSIRGKLFDLGAYPGAVPSRTESRVRGQVYELPNDPEVLARIDQHEEFDPHQPHAGVFVRKRRRVRLESGNKVSGWVYFYNGSLDGARLVESGDYKRAYRRRQ